MTFQEFKEGIRNYFSLSAYLVSQQEAEASIREGVTFRGTNMLILIMAIFIASLGLNTNSTAVIIGAMLISPLMGPIIGVGLAVGIQDFALLKRSGRNLGAAALFSVIASTLYFLISPVAEGHSELLARTSPTIYDVLIGFFGGAAGILALGSRSKGNVIPGVAIATALMPPLCTVGYGVATWQPHYFLGASYLFVINSVFIALSTFIGVKAMGYTAVATNDPARARKVQRMVYTVAILTLLPSVYLTYNMLRANNFSLSVDKFVNKECVWPETRVINVSTDWHSRRPSVITLTLLGHTMPRDSLMAALDSRLRYYGLEGAKVSVLQGDMAVAASNAKGDTKDAYEVSQRLLEASNRKVDSLKNVISGKTLTTRADEMLPELKIAFPQITSLALVKTDFAISESNDSIANKLRTVAIIGCERPIRAAERHRLSEYLSVRLKTENIDLILR